MTTDPTVTLTHALIAAGVPVRERQTGGAEDACLLLRAARDGHTKVIVKLGRPDYEPIGDAIAKITGPYPEARAPITQCAEALGLDLDAIAPGWDAAGT